MFDGNEFFIRKKEAARRFGVQIRTLERWGKAGLFPRRVQIGPLAVGYRASDLEEFAKNRPIVKCDAELDKPWQTTVPSIVPAIEAIAPRVVLKKGPVIV